MISIMRTITLHGRQFPVVKLVCPPVDGHDDSDWDRSLGDETSFYLPAENGILFEIEPRPKSMWNMHIYSSVCEFTRSATEEFWLPIQLSYTGGEIVRYSLNAQHTWGWEWLGAHEDWLVETIDRLSRMRVPEFDGPRVRIVDFNEVLDGQPA